MGELSILARGVILSLAKDGSLGDRTPYKMGSEEAEDQVRRRDRIEQE